MIQLFQSLIFIVYFTVHNSSNKLVSSQSLQKNYIKKPQEQIPIKVFSLEVLIFINIMIGFCIIF